MDAILKNRIIQGNFCFSTNPPEEDLTIIDTHYKPCTYSVKLSSTPPVAKTVSNSDFGGNNGNNDDDCPDGGSRHSYAPDNSNSDKSTTSATNSNIQHIKNHFQPRKIVVDLPFYQSDVSVFCGF